MKEDKTQYQAGDTAEGDFKVCSIFGADKDFIVYFTEDNYLKWEINEGTEPEHFTDILAEFNEISTKIEQIVCTKKCRLKITNALGRTLFTSYTSKECDTAKACFGPVRAMVDAEHRFYCEVYYVFWALAALVGIAIVTTLIWRYLTSSELSNDTYWTFAVGIICGSLGAFVSVLVGREKMEIPEYAKPKTHLSKGLFRILLGGLCGFIIVLLFKAELVMGKFKDSNYAIGAFSIAAGVSENYVLELLKSLTKK